MAVSWTSWISLYFLGILVIGVASGTKPSIVPKNESVVIDVGGTLNLTCHGNHSIVWATNNEKLKYTNYEEIYDDGLELPYIARLMIENMNYTNVGYFFCIYNTTENRLKTKWSPTDDDLSSIYVYVKDEDHLLARDAELVMYHAVVNKNFTFPCKPSFPDVKVELDKIQGTFKAPYDPREGFIIETPSVKNNSGSYICEASYGTLSVEKNIELGVIAHEETLNSPTVMVADYWQRDQISEQLLKMEVYDVEEGATFNLTCIYDHSLMNNRFLDWHFPPTFTNESGNHLIYRRVDPGAQMLRVLKIVNASPLTDSGNYSCLARTSHVESDPTTVNINVIPSNKNYVELKPDYAHIEETSVDDNVKWMVMYRAHPEPTFIWQKGDTIVYDSSRPDGDKRYRLEQDSQHGSLFLEILSPTINDIGNYILEAKIEEDEKIVAEHKTELNFTMPVPASVTSILISPQTANEMIPENENFEIRCNGYGYPKPMLRLEFSQCSAINNCSDFEPVSMVNGTQLNELAEIPSHQPSDAAINQTSGWQGRALVQGRYRCSAHNIHGHNSRVKDFIITDGNQLALSLVLLVNGERIHDSAVLEGDNVTIQCRGNKLLTSPTSQWLLNDQPYNSSDFPLEQADTDLSYISEIKMENIRLGPNDLHFVCNNNNSLEATRIITVNPTMVPTWKDQVEPLQDMDLKEMGNLTLSCPAEGAPSPELRWYKNDVLLPETTSEMDRKIQHRIVEGSRINFRYLKMTDSGKYKCEAINRAGTVSSEAIITVTDPDALDNFKTIMIFVIIGSILCLVIIILAIFYVRKVNRDRKRAHFLKLETQRIFNEGDPENLNPDLGLEEQAELLPYDTKYEVPRDSIIFDKLLGAGAFGRVYRATALNLIPGQGRTTVAVKMMKSRTDNAQLKALRSEVKIMIHIGRHVNIVNLLGACSKDLATKGELLLLVEYCKYGNILDYMRRHRKDFVNQINDNDKIDPSITESRIRQRSGSGSRTRVSRGLKYAHLSFNQDSVSYAPGHETSDGFLSQNSWAEPSSPTESVLTNGLLQDHSRARTFSGGSSDVHVMSDMTIMTTESSNGGSDSYITSRASAPANMSSMTLLSWAFQIAKGMEYLAFKKVLHGDLAARNILLTDDNVVKISDFGLAKDIYKNDNYTKKSKTPLPWKWLAPESFRDGVFSTQSDIWSYGVVLWEIFNLGQIPYPGVDFDESFIAKLEKGIRLEQPRYATYELYRVMMNCWNSEPVDRPTFTQLEGVLGEMLGEAEKQHYLDLNTPYQTENTASTFLNFLQSPDYSAKIRERTPTKDDDGYEMPFSPSPCGTMGMTLGAMSLQSPRMTPLQIHYQDDILSDGSAGTYLSMSSPTKMGQNVFSFDPETVDAISKRDSKLQQSVNDPDENYSRDATYLTMESSSPTCKSPGNNGIAKSVVPMRQKLQRTASQLEKHDSGLYSPTASMQINPQYVMVDSFKKVDESNYLTKEGFQDLCDGGKQTDYVNYEISQSPTAFPRSYPKDMSVNCEYTNVQPNGHFRGRTISESSSGLGSISEESSPEFRDKPDSLKSSVMESAILEEPPQVCV